mmetsp:Transcript_7820/g.33234  ORF Transcript_7820/g.33234 Transcript_7820/m.33234 type:complete len:719 (+) Transcript_7820:931-3087(+)
MHHREHLRRRVVHGAKPLRGDLHPVSAVRCCDERRTPRGDARRSSQRKRVAGFVRRDVARASAAPLERRRGVPPPALHGRLELAVEPLPPELLARAVALLARAVRLAHHDAAAHRRRRLRGRPSRRVDDEHRADRVQQRARVRARRRRRLKPLEPPFHDLRRDRERVRAPERGLQRRDVVHHAPETPHVRLVVVRLLLDHLRTRVRHRAHRGSSSPARFGAFLFVTLVYRISRRQRLRGQRRGEPEVHQLNAPRVPVHQNVVRRDVPVHHPRFVVHVAQRQQNLGKDVPEKRFGRVCVRRAEPSDALRQRRALRELHHDEHRAFVCKGLDVPHDVRVVQPRQDAHLARHRVRETGLATDTRVTRFFFGVRLGEGTKALVLREHLLHGACRADAARARFVRAVHLAEGALAQALHQRVPAHDAGRVRGTLAGGIAREKKTRAPVVEEKTIPVGASAATRRALSRFLERVRESRRARLREPEPPRRDTGVPIELGLVLPDVDERREEVRREQSLESDAHALAVARKNKTQRAKRVRARLFARRRGAGRFDLVDFCDVGRRARARVGRRRLGVRRASLERPDQHAPERVDAVGARDGFAAVVVGGEFCERRTTQTRRRRFVRRTRGLPQPPKRVGDQSGRARGARLGHRRAVVQESAQHAKRQRALLLLNARVCVAFAFVSAAFIDRGGFRAFVLRLRANELERDAHRARGARAVPTLLEP